MRAESFVHLGTVQRFAGYTCNPGPTRVRANASEFGGFKGRTAMRLCAGGAAGRAATAPPSRLAGILRHRWCKKNPALASGALFQDADLRL